MIYVLLSLIWSAVIIYVIHSRHRIELSEYSKALEQLSSIIPSSVEKIGEAIRASLYPGVTVLDGDMGSSRDIVHETPNDDMDDLFTAVPGPNLDWEEMI